MAVSRSTSLSRSPVDTRQNPTYGAATARLKPGNSALPRGGRPRGL